MPLTFVRKKLTFIRSPKIFKIVYIVGEQETHRVVDYTALGNFNSFSHISILHVGAFVKS
jgi:hypothetical protein